MAVEIGQHAQQAPAWSVGDGKSYLLEYGYHSSARLNLQYHIWQRILGFVIHPTITLPSRSRIADVACGTAFWALDAAEQHDVERIDAYDIDLSGVPPAAWLPSSLHTSIWDFFQDPPEAACGAYDMLHTRLLLIVLAGPDPLPVLRRFYTMLKPGGVLQWEDIDLTGMRVEKVDEAVPTPHTDELVQMSKGGGRQLWTSRLPEMLQQVGFVDVRREAVQTRPSLRRALMDVNLLANGEYAGVLSRTGDEAGARRILETTRAAYDEALHGAAATYTHICVVARKPQV